MTDEDLDTLDAGLRAVQRAALDLVARLALAEVELPPDLRRLEGAIRGLPVAMPLRRFTGGAFAALTLATIVDRDDRLHAVTIIGTPADDSLAPILGVDLVALAGSLSLVAVDLAPTDDATWSAIAEPRLASLHRATKGRIVARRLPEFAAEVFSPRALLAGVHRGHTSAVLDAIAEFVVGLAPIFAPTSAADPTRRAAARDRGVRWRLAERRNRREHDALARIFGADPAAALIDLLFPG